MRSCCRRLPSLIAIGAAACGTQKINIPKSDPNYKSDYAAAEVFNQRCGGCHTLSYAGTHGSAANPRTAEPINGPNFNVRCERPAIRVLYAIANGGFEGAYMPQNVVVGQQAREVAMFVSRFAGRQAPIEPGPGVTPCHQADRDIAGGDGAAVGRRVSRHHRRRRRAPTAIGLATRCSWSASATELKFDQASLTAPKAAR